MMNLEMPKNNLPDAKVSKIKDIWYGKDINAVRKAHVDNKANSIDICKSCPLKKLINGKK